ncbi:hypothetical protein K9M74_02315 [Candidatus Woesearchaeota archaeon]|nr:hypothetical protein [Candidatus Woesearchaeota archaeon]
MKQLLAIRKILKSKKPTFTRHDAHKKKRVGTGWRRPKGRQNKMRLHRKGYAKIRSTGYSSPVDVRGLSKEGLTQNVVANLKDFTTLNAKKDGVIIASTVGGRKRIVLLDFIEKNNFTLINLDAKVARSAIDEKLALKSAKRKEITKRKESKAKAKEKAAKAAKEAKDKEKSEKEKDTADKQNINNPHVEKQEAINNDAKVEEKKEHDKVLTKKE